MLLDEVRGLAGDGIGHVFIGPAGGLSATHVPDPADAVDNRLVVPVAGMHLEQFRVLLARGIVADRPVETDFNRIVWIEPHDALILHIDTGDTVAGGGDQETVVESDFPRTGLDLLVPIQFLPFGAQAQVPLADGTGGVARVLHQQRQRLATRFDNHPRIAPRDTRPLVAPGVFTGQHGIARGRTGRRGGMGIGKAHPLGRQPVDIRGLDLGRPVAADVAIAEIVRIDNHHIGTFGLGGPQFHRQGRCYRGQTE